jgi:endoglucanase
VNRFWATPQQGANGFSQTVTSAWWQDAKAAGLSWVRLAPDKWSKAAGQRDFLVGNTDHFQGLVAADLKRLIACLDDANDARVRVVLTLLSLPGARWRQHNGDRSDPKLWRDPGYLKSAEKCWIELARALKGHPSLVAYDPLNEPHPKQIPGSTVTVNTFNARLVAAIRSVDNVLPIFIESDDYCSPAEFATLEPLPDPALLYTFHLYDPWSYTSSPKERGKWRYPTHMPLDWKDFVTTLAPVCDWQKRHNIPASQIVAAEYGCHRQAQGAPAWLAAATDAIERQGWHRAFYSFREDTWNGMDYEIGVQLLSEAYWKAQEAGKPIPPPRNKETPHWKALKLSERKR